MWWWWGGLCLFCSFVPYLLTDWHSAHRPNLPQSAFFYLPICFNCTVVHDRANGRQVPVIKQSGEFKHLRSSLEQSVSLDNR